MVQRLHNFCSQIFFIFFFHNKRDQEVQENFISCFLKSHLEQFDLFRSFSNVLLDVVKIEPDHCYYWILKQSGLIKILKPLGHDFSGKPLCDGQCTEILCDVYVWRSIFNRWSYGFIKKLL